jgi:hypothetical protein
LRDVTNDEFHAKSFVYNTDGVKRSEADYDFDREWQTEENSRDNSIDDQEFEDEKKKSHEIYIENPGGEPQDDDSSCSVSSILYNKSQLLSMKITIVFSARNAPTANTTRPRTLIQCRRVAFAIT